MQLAFERPVLASDSNMHMKKKNFKSCSLVVCKWFRLLFSLPPDNYFTWPVDDRRLVPVQTSCQQKHKNI